MNENLLLLVMSGLLAVSILEFLNNMIVVRRNYKTHEDNIKQKEKEIAHYRGQLKKYQLYNSDNKNQGIFFNGIETRAVELD